jgi:hypothetical protein
MTHCIGKPLSLTLHPPTVDRDVVNSLESDHSVRLTLAVTANTSLTRTSRFKQEPNSALCFVNPDLNQACGGNIVVLVA